MSAETVVLAYSGGLDTSCILKWLKLEGYRVIAFVADVGQDDDLEQVKRNAEATGADGVAVASLQGELVEGYIVPAVMGNAVYESRYLLGTSLARPVIAKAQVECARAEGAEVVSHGATGKGNDQVRFELTYAALAPDLQVIAPWKIPAFHERFRGRSDLIRFAKEQGIDIPVTLEKPFSTDANLMHKSYESGILEDAAARPDRDMFSVCVDPRDAPDEETLIEISFAAGRPVRVRNLGDGQEEEGALAVFRYLNEVGRANGIGRVDIVENRFVGIKSRGVYETPGGTILHAALRDLEGIAMDKEVLRLRDLLAPRLADAIYNGFWFSPEMDVLLGAVERCHAHMDGEVRLALYKGNVIQAGRTSPNALYDPELSSMDVAGGFDPTDSRGFIRINALRLKAHRAVTERRAGR